MSYDGGFNSTEPVMSKKDVEVQQEAELTTYQLKITALKKEARDLTSEISLKQAELKSMIESARLELQTAENLSAQQQKQFSLEQERSLQLLDERAAALDRLEEASVKRLTEAEVLEIEFKQKIEELNIARVTVNSIRADYDSAFLRLRKDIADLDQREAAIREKEKEVEQDADSAEHIFKEIRAMQDDVRASIKVSDEKKAEAEALMKKAFDRLEEAQKLHTSLLITQQERDEIEGLKKKLEDELANVKPYLDTLIERESRLVVRERAVEIEKREASTRLQEAKNLEKKLAQP
jgi:hypothetical protein